MRHALAGTERREVEYLADTGVGTDVADSVGMTSQKTLRSFVPHLLAAAALAVGVSGCYVEADGPRPPPHCHEAVWIHAHRDRYGDFHPGHYRCAGEVTPATAVE